MDEHNLGFQPRGFILNLHKYYNPPKNHFDETKEYFDNYFQKQECFTTFGNFDRLSFNPVMDFADYRETIDRNNMWLGNRQNVLLYPISPADKRCYGFSGDHRVVSGNHHFGLVDNLGQFTEINSNYLLITLLYTASDAKASLKSYECYLGYCSDAIYRIADTYNTKFAESGKHLECEVFGTFNSAELAVVWSADEFVDVLYLIDHLRYLTLRGYKEDRIHRAFISSHTFAALTKKNMTEVQGGALIQLAGRTSAGIDEKETSGHGQNGYEVLSGYVTNVRKTLLEVDDKVAANHVFCTGEYDLIFQTDQRFLSKLFGDVSRADSDLQFSIQNRVFSSHILESSTRLYYTAQDIDELKKTLEGLWGLDKESEGLLYVTVREDDQGSHYSPRMNIVRKITPQDVSVAEEEKNSFTLFQELFNSVSRISKASLTFRHTLELAYIDYVQCITTAVDHLWVKDFDSQFHAALSILLRCCKSMEGPPTVSSAGDAVSPSDFQELIQDVFQALQQQCYHVVDSGKFFLEEPRSHYNYTGQYDLMMHAYYGILKCLLERMYIPSRPQSSMYPLINFEPTPILGSKLYWEDMHDTPKSSPIRLLVIKLPYNDAWTLLDHYIPMLIHELYHYAAPRSRIRRNYYFGCIAMTWLHSQLLGKYFEKQAEQGEYPHLLSEGASLLTNRCTEILSEQFGQILYSSMSNSETDCFSAKYQNFLTRLIEEQSTHYDKVFATIVRALEKGLSSMDERNEWKNMIAPISSPEQKKALEQMLSQTITILKNSEKDHGEQILSSYVSFLNEVVDGCWVPIFAVLKELFPDIAMVKFAGLDAAGYMLQFSINQNNQLLPPDKDKMPFENGLRIGCVLDWLLGNLSSDKNTTPVSDCIPKLEAVRARFLHLYNRIYKEKDDMGERWFDYYMCAYTTYLDSCTIYAQWLAPLIQEEYLSCLKEEDNSESMKLLTSLCKEYYNILENDSDDTLEESLFHHSIKIVQSFQVQKSLKEIQKTRPAAPLEDKPHMPLRDSKSSLRLGVSLWDYKWNLHLNNASELHTQLSHAVQILRESHQRAFRETETYRPWFRGCKNATFDILPSIMVHFLDNIAAKDFRDTINAIGTLADYQRRLLEAFKFRADGAPELLNSHQYQRLDYLALMQHYGQFTGLLDWSEDAYSSLYFALEKFVDDPRKKLGDDKNEDEAAALYILDPMLYNLARKKMLQTLNTIPEEYRRTLEGGDGYVPNLSLSDNREKFSLFIPGGHVNSPAKRYHSVSTPPQETELDDIAIDELYNLPLAIYTSRLNPRLRAQSGIFLSYNLRSVPVWPESVPKPNDTIASANLFHYLSLETIQRYYLSKFYAAEPFLLKVHINRNLKRELGDTLRFLGMNRYRIYPELEQLSKK